MRELGHSGKPKKKELLLKLDTVQPDSCVMSRRKALRSDVFNC